MQRLWLASVNNISRFFKCKNYKHDTWKMPSIMFYFSSFRNIIWRLKLKENANNYWKKTRKFINSSKKFSNQSFFTTYGTIRLEVPGFTIRLEVPSAWCPAPRLMIWKSMFWFSCEKNSIYPGIGCWTKMWQKRIWCLWMISPYLEWRSTSNYKS